ncbi:MAG: endopeptidase La [Candidatus Eisenbacteria bacterium]|nr:endopeptidase La [Candidatus Eisenbacteria bacterium]
MTLEKFWRGKSADILESSIPEVLPILPLMSTVLFPLGVATVQVGFERNLRLIREHSKPEEIVGIFLSRRMNSGKPEPEEIEKIGIAARVIRLVNMPSGTVQVALEGLRRIAIVEYVKTEPYLEAKVECLKETVSDPSQASVLVEKIIQLARNLVEVDRAYPRELVHTLSMNAAEPGTFADFVATAIDFELEGKQRTLSSLDVVERLEVVREVLENVFEKRRVLAGITKDAKLRIKKTDRERFLREELKTIRKELGEDEPQESEIELLRKKLAELSISQPSKKYLASEIQKLRTIPPSSTEYGPVKNYLDWVLSLPWGKELPEEIDLKKVEEILNEDHYGMEKVKERIVEYLAVRKLRKDVTPSILCFVGPPGTAKTSLSESVARALNRPFLRVNVGGVTDEAEIRGERKTLPGSQPGKIIRALRGAETNNPVFMLDEVDRVRSEGTIGEPWAALFEALNPESNSSFVDNYLGIPYDLSRVLFMASANIAEFIPEALLELMETIELPGYTDTEKFEIAKRFIIPRRAVLQGLSQDEIRLSNDALEKIIELYTNEAGVRELVRQVDFLLRKYVKRKALGEKGPWDVTSKDVETLLGAPPYLRERGESEPEVGVATGLAWTGTGGSLLLVEALKMHGSGKLVITGQLGEIMKESVQAAYSYVRSRADFLEIDQSNFSDYDVHVHFPQGAVPKDGPSSGITTCLAIASALSEKPVRNDIAMTGEITLRGRILGVGGLKEKMLAAHRVGISSVIVPKENEKDLEEIPAEIREKMQVSFVERIDEVFRLALLNIVIAPGKSPDEIVVEEIRKRRSSGKITIEE